MWNTVLVLRYLILRPTRYYIILPVHPNHPMDPEELDYQYSCRKWSIKTVDVEEVVDDFIRITLQASEETRSTIPHEMNIRYGEGEKQKLDVYGTDLPKDSELVLFLHGGYWQALDKESSAGLVPPLYRHGFKVIVAGYDLTPNVRVSDIMEEIKTLIAFLLQMAKESGSPAIWMVGHSAGAHLLSSLLAPHYQATLTDQERHLLKGMVLVSGIYELHPLQFTHINDLAQLDKHDEVQKCSTHMYFSNPVTTKVLLTLGKYESPEFHRQSFEANERAVAAGNNSELLIMQPCDHFDIIEDLRHEHFELTQKIIKFFGK